MPITVYVLAICQALMLSSTTLMVTAATLVGFALAEDKALATLPLAIQLLGTMATSIPASLFMGRFGRKAGFLLAAVIGILSGGMVVFSILQGWFWGFCVGAAGIGVFNGFGTYFRLAAADGLDLAQRPRAISYVLAGGVIAAFIGPNLANYGQNLIADARFAGSFLFVIGLYAIALLILAFTRFAPVPQHERGHGGRPLAEIAGQPRYIVAVICAMFGYGIMTLVMTATPLAMDHHHHVFSDTAFVIQWHVLGMFAPSFFTGRLINRLGVVRVLQMGALLLIACLAINLLGTSVTHFWIALFALGVGWNFLFIGGTAMLTETYRPEERAKAQALNDFLVFSATSVASLGAGALLHAWGWQWVNLAVIPFVALILVSLGWLFLVERRLELVGAAQGGVD